MAWNDDGCVAMAFETPINNAAAHSSTSNMRECGQCHEYNIDIVEIQYVCVTSWRKRYFVSVNRQHRTRLVLLASCGSFLVSSRPSKKSTRLGI